MEVGKEFVDLASYNKNMAKGMEDKLFFLNHFDWHKNYVFVDFGCADGTMISTMFDIFKQEKEYNNDIFIGYDISETMIEFAKTKFSQSTDNVFFTTNWNDVLSKLNSSKHKKKILILSSVIHEVFSYAKNNDDIIDFWNKVLNTGFDYIFVRDMMVSSDINRTKPNTYPKLIFNNHFEQLKDFEEKWGTIDNNENLVHFLLKYRWKINWNRELNENYFPIYIEEFLKQMKGYNIDYFERFRVPFLENCWKEEFGIQIDDFTHIKAIFSKSKASNN